MPDCSPSLSRCTRELSSSAPVVRCLSPRIPCLEMGFPGAPQLVTSTSLFWVAYAHLQLRCCGKSCRHNGLGQLTGERASGCRCSHPGLLRVHCHLDRKARVRLPDRRTCSARSIALWGRWEDEEIGIHEAMVFDWPHLVWRLLEVEFYFLLFPCDSTTSLTESVFTKRLGVAFYSLKANIQQTTLFPPACQSEGGPIET